jgi:predicted 3-demethylubiquinone-9 3-methyltransferase (glyoxalase superfamily)
VPETKQKITPCLWFDTQAEEAANFYISVFKNSRIKHVSRYGKAGREVHGKEAGSVMVVEFEIDGQTFTALNGGPHFKCNEAVSFQVSCATQAEIDHFWSRLSQGGQESRCGWLKDKYGVSGRSFHAAADDDQRRRRNGGPGHERGSEDEKVRSRRAQPCLCRARMRGRGSGR